MSASAVEAVRRAARAAYSGPWLDSLGRVHLTVDRAAASGVGPDDLSPYPAHTAGQRHVGRWLTVRQEQGALRRGVVKGVAPNGVFFETYQIEISGLWQVLQRPEMQQFRRLWIESDDHDDAERRTTEQPG